MKRRFAEPVGRETSPFSVKAENPEKLDALMEDPYAQARDMSLEQAAAFVPPERQEERVRRSQRDQGRT